MTCPLPSFATGHPKLSAFAVNERLEFRVKGVAATLTPPTGTKPANWFGVGALVGNRRVLVPLPNPNWAAAVGARPSEPAAALVTGFKGTPPRACQLIPAAKRAGGL